MQSCGVISWPVTYGIIYRVVCCLCTCKSAFTIHSSSWQYLHHYISYIILWGYKRWRQSSLIEAMSPSLCFNSTPLVRNFNTIFLFRCFLGYQWFWICFWWSKLQNSSFKNKSVGGQGRYPSYSLSSGCRLQCRGQLALTIPSAMSSSIMSGPPS